MTFENRPWSWLSFTKPGYMLHSKRFESSDLDHSMHGKVCIVTGGSSGVGKAAAYALAQRGAEVWILSRNRDRGLDAVDQLRQQTKNHHIELAVMDVSDLDEVEAFCSTFPRNRVDVLIHNAVSVFPHLSFTRQGIERNFSCSVLGPYLLTTILYPKLNASDDARVIFVSSGGMYTQKLDLEALFGKSDKHYNDLIAYAQAKRAQVILAEMLAKKWLDSNVSVHSMHPGWVDTPGVRRFIPKLYRPTRLLLRSQEQGADTVVWLAVSPSENLQTGQFWFDRNACSSYWLPRTRELASDRERLIDECNLLIKNR